MTPRPDDNAHGPPREMREGPGGSDSLAASPTLDKRHGDRSRNAPVTPVGPLWSICKVTPIGRFGISRWLSDKTYASRRDAVPDPQVIADELGLLLVL